MSKVDRQTTVPFLLNLCYKIGSHHRPDEFPLPPDHVLPRDRIQIYTWQTCTLRELSHLLTTALPDLVPSPIIGTRLSYRLVYPDAKEVYLSRGATTAKYLVKELGSVVIEADENNKTKYDGEPDKTLADARFVIGDFVSCAIYPPGSNGEIGPAPDTIAARGRLYSDRGRENGFRGGRGDRGIPPGEWRRGERIPDEGRGRGGFGRGRGRQW